MKKLLLLFSLSIALALSAKAQTSVYHPFPDSDAVWCCEWGSPCSDCADNWVTYILNGKVRIDSFIYNKLTGYGFGYYCSDIFQCQGCMCNTGAGSYNDTINYYIRQDTFQRKIYLYDSSAHKDLVLYDFKLMAGDTLNRIVVNNGIYNASFVISSVDSILLRGVYRRIYYYPICAGSDSSAIIEGVGDICGLFAPPSNCFEYFSSLNDFIQDFHVYIGDLSHLQCTNFSLGIAKIAKHNAYLSPNPFHTSSTLSISDSRFKNGDLKIYDVMGRIVQQQIINPENSGSTIINRDGLGDGLYFYRLTNSEGLMLTGKFVVN